MSTLTAFPGRTPAQAFVQSPAKARGGEEEPPCIVFGEVICGSPVQGVTVRALRNGQVVGTSTTNSQGQYIINIPPGGADMIEVSSVTDCEFYPAVSSYTCPGEYYVPFVYGCPEYKSNRKLRARFLVDVTYRVRVFCYESGQNPFIDGCGEEIGGGVVNAKLDYTLNYVPGITPPDVELPYQITVLDVYGETDHAQFATCEYPGTGRIPLTPDHLIPGPVSSFNSTVRKHLLKIKEGKYIRTNNTRLNNLARGVSASIPFSAASTTYNPLGSYVFNHYFHLGNTNIVDCFTNYTSIRMPLILFHYDKSYTYPQDFFDLDPVSSDFIFKYPLDTMEEPEYFCNSVTARTKIDILSNSSYVDVFFLP